jgi:hypothetical protein
MLHPVLAYLAWLAWLPGQVKAKPFRAPYGGLDLTGIAMLVSGRYLAQKEKWGRSRAGGVVADRREAAASGYKTFFFLRQILKTTGQMPRVASRPALKGRRRVALTQTKVSAKKPGTQKPDKP